MGQELSGEGIVGCGAYKYVYIASVLCVGSACMHHTQWCTIKYILFVLLVYHTCTSRSVMTFNLFSRLYLHCSTKRLLEQLPKQYLALTLHFDTFRYFRYVTFCCVNL